MHANTDIISVPRELVFLSSARESLAQATRIDDIKQIADKAEAVRQYAKKQRLGVEMQNQAAELKMEAERRAGEILADMPLNGGDRKSESRDVTVKLSDLGIARMQSHRWQTLARMPIALFRDYIDKVKESGKELTTAGALKLAKQDTAKNPAAVPEAYEDECTDDLQTFVSAGKKFGCIYADPAWKYGNQGTRASTDNHYETMTVEQICGLPVPKISADNAHLHLWTTNAFIREAFKVMEAWGYEYKSMRIWVKPQMGIGNYWRVSHEILLFGIKGNCPFRARNKMSWLNISRTKHSAKPGKFRIDIEDVSTGPFLEMFARTAAPGWCAWGNQIQKDTGLFKDEK